MKKYTPHLIGLGGFGIMYLSRVLGSDVLLVVGLVILILSFLVIVGQSKSQD